MINDEPRAPAEFAALAACISTIGNSNFYPALLRLGQAICGVEHLSVFAFSNALEPRIDVLEGLDDPSITALSARSYMGFGYHGLDPARERLRALSATEDAPAIFVLKAHDIADVHYRRDIYERFGLDGRISLIGRSEGGWRSLNFYKHVSTGGLTEHTITALANRAQYLFAAESRHLAIVRERASEPIASPIPPLDFLKEVLSTVAPGLSGREAEVCARALQGVTGEGIALEMGIAETTVATLKRRAYGKLGISTLNELFARCLSQAAWRPESGRKLDTVAAS